MERVQQAASVGSLQARSMEQRSVGQVAVACSKADRQHPSRVLAGQAAVDNKTAGACSTDRAVDTRHTLMAAAEVEAAVVRQKMEAEQRDRTTESCEMDECSPMPEPVSCGRTRPIVNWVADSTDGTRVLSRVGRC